MLVKIKQQLNLIFSQKEFKKIIRINLGFLFFLMLIFGIFWFNLPPLAPLFYSRAWGEEQLAPNLWFLLLLGFSFLFLVINLRLASIFVKREKLLAYVLIWTSLILTILTSVTLVRIFLLVT